MFSPAGSVGASKLRLEVSTGHPHLHPPEHGRILRKPNGELPTRRGELRSPEHDWSLHKPNDEPQPVGEHMPPL